VINADVDTYLAEAEAPGANSPSVKDHSLFQKLFASEIPSHIEGFRCSDKDQMAVVWPAGTDAAREVSWTYNEDIVPFMICAETKMLRRFLHTKSRDTHLGLADPLEDGAEASEKRNRAMVYNENRDRADRDTTSRLR
jgi:deoxyribodipyrimidine photo-lyase